MEGQGNVLFAEPGGVVCEQVDDNVAGGGLEEDAHGYGGGRITLNV